MRKPSPSGINYEECIGQLNQIENNAAAIQQMPRALQAAFDNRFDGETSSPALCWNLENLRRSAWNRYNVLEDSEQLLASKTCSQVPESSDGERIASSTTESWESKTKIHEFNKYSYFSSQRSNKERGHSERNACSQLILFLRRQLILKKGMSSPVMEEISLSA